MVAKIINEMRRKYPILILLFVLLLSNTMLLAQNDSINDISYYFDDGISGQKNLIKLNAMSIINGDLPVFYERILGNSIGIEVGVGLLLPYYVYELGDIFTEGAKIENFNLGYSLWIHPKYYVTHNAPELGYWGIQFRKRNYSQTKSFTDITINTGAQYIIGKRMTISVNVGMGIRFNKDKTNETSELEEGFIIPFAIKIGYLW